MEEITKFLVDGKLKDKKSAKPFVRAVVMEQFNVEPNKVETYEWDVSSRSYKSAGHQFEIECVYSVGGGEGGGESVDRVFCISEGDNVIVYYRVTGYYASYVGTEWDSDFTIVEPRDVVVTQYFAV